MKEYERVIEKQIKERLFEENKVLVIYGPRQVGKTTLAKKILRDYKSEAGYFNCEIFANREVLMSGSPERMLKHFGGHKVIVFDEAQSVENIGRGLKIFIDTFPNINVIATGSSSFDLANKINEPLTGRHYEFFLPPLSTQELLKGSSNLSMRDNLKTRLIYGNYPEIVNAENDNRAQEKLELIATSYLYRDILQFNNIKSSEILNNILIALAHQVGSEVSYNEIANLVGIDRKTVMSYIGLLEQAFIIFRLLPLTRNKRDEIKKLRKIYFYDNGIINALTRNFASVDSGRALGGLWENYMVSERLKWLKNNGAFRYMYYWRRNRGGEVDYIEEYNGDFHPYEFKWNKDAASRGVYDFIETYKPKSELEVINKDNFLSFLS